MQTYTPVLWCIRNHSKYKKKYNTDKASDYWVPLHFKKWDMKEADVDRVKNNLKTLHEDPPWKKQAELEWEEKAKRTREETEEVPF